MSSENFDFQIHCDMEIPMDNVLADTWEKLGPAPDIEIKTA
jgi:hypothetical protein